MHRSGVPASLTSLLQWLAMLLCALAMLAWSAGVSAHASFVGSTPAAAAVLPHAPTDVQLMFNEPVSPLVLKIIQPDGAIIDITQTHILPKGLALSLPVLEQRGTHALSWRVVSGDGHPVGGTLTFSVGAKGAGSTQAAPTNPGRALLIWLARLGGYVGLFFGIGLAACHALNAARHNTRQSSLWLLMLGAAATLASLGLQGVDALDRPLWGLFSIDVWRTAGTTSFGLSAILTLAALICAASARRTIPSLPQRIMAGTAIILLGAALAASGHASAAPPAWLARPTVWLHTIAITLWIGSLLPLAYTLSDDRDMRLLTLFSRHIPVVLLVLFASGGVLVYLQFDTLSSLWLTAYGQVLALKLALLLVLLGLGAYNRYYLTDAVLRAEPAPRRSLRRFVYLECVLAFAILGVVALWRFTPPPRTLQNMPVAAVAISAHIHAGTALANVSFMPAIGGQPASMTLYLFSPNRTPLVAQEVDVALSNASAGIEPIVFSAIKVSDGAWQVSNIELPHQDNWHLRIDALVSDFERISLDTTLELPFVGD